MDGFISWWKTDKNLRGPVLFLAACSLLVFLWLVPEEPAALEEGAAAPLQAEEETAGEEAPAPPEVPAEEGPALSREAFAASLEGEGVWEAFGRENYVLIGDSRIVGFSLYGYLPEERVLAEYGASIPYVRTRTEDFSALSPDTVILAFGINDMLTGIWNTPKAYADQVLTDIGRLRERVPDADYYVCSILPALSPALEENPVWNQVPAYNEALRTMCREEGFFFIDAGALVMERQDLYAADGLHLDAAFYPLWGRVMQEAIYDAHLSP